jgi:hypothetical protein
VANILFIPNGSGGGGSSQDRFAPKYLVGNVNNGDSTTSYSTDGFYYIPDLGDGDGIALALSYADSSSVDFVATGDVWIRPGIYTTENSFTVPADVTVRGAGPSTIIVGVPGAINQGLFTMKAGSSLRSMAITHSEPAPPAVPGTSFGVVGLYEAGTVVIEDVSVTSVWSGATNTTLNACFSVSTPTPVSEAFMKCFRCSAVYEANSNNDPVTNILTTLCGYRAFDANLELLECDSAFSLFGFGPSVLCAGSSAIDGRAAQSLRVEGGRYTSQAIGIASQSTGGFIPQISLVGTRVRCATAFSNTEYAAVKLIGDGSHSVTGSSLKAATNTCVLINPFGAAAGASRGQIGNNTIETAAGSSAWKSNPGGATESYHTFIGNTYKGLIAGQTTANDEVAHNINLP